jgi:RNA-directed DNA polymerase
MTHAGQFLILHSDHKIRRFVQVRSDRSPFDGDWVYWAMRRGKYPDTSPRVAKLLKTQQGRCGHCHRPFGMDDLMEVHHRDGNHGNNGETNLSLLHRHCHDVIHGRGADDRRRHTEEPYESKGSRTVLEPGAEGRPSAPR